MAPRKGVLLSHGGHFAGAPEWFGVAVCKCACGSTDWHRRITSAVNTWSFCANLCSTGLDCSNGRKSSEDTSLTIPFAEDKQLASMRTLPHLGDTLSLWVHSNAAMSSVMCRRCEEMKPAVCWTWLTQPSGFLLMCTEISRAFPHFAWIRNTAFTPRNWTRAVVLGSQTAPLLRVSTKPERKQTLHSRCVSGLCSALVVKWHENDLRKSPRDSYCQAHVLCKQWQCWTVDNFKVRPAWTWRDKILTQV